MGVNDRGPRKGTVEALRAPERVVNMLVGVMRPPPSQLNAPPGSGQHVELARANARHYADLIWAQAYVAGMADAMARDPRPMRIELVGELATKLAENLGSGPVCAHCEVGVHFDGSRWRHNLGGTVACVNGRTMARPAQVG